MRGSALATALALAASLACAATAHARGESCSEDADCAAGERCVMNDSSCDAPPSAGDGNGDPKDAIPGGGCASAEPELGSCEPGPIACETGADCPAGLACRKGSAQCTSPTPGGDPECAPSAEPGRCTYEPEECELDADCTQQGHACVALGETEDCSGSAAAPCPRDGNCPPPPEPVCTRETHHYCFPTRVDCERDADCATDWRCVTLSEGAMDNPPPGWEDAERVCLPEGLALVIEGRVEVGGGFAGASEDSSAARDLDDAKGDANAQAPSAGASDPKAEANDVVVDDGCAVAAAGAGAGQQAWAWLALLGLAWRRRRMLRG